MLKYAIGGALLVAATHSLGLSLGGAQGAAIIGRPLDMSVRVSTDPAEAASGLCLEAELLYGESRVSPSAVTVAVQKLADDGVATVRVRSSLPVNEPIVTLQLRAGCTQKFTRSYALLADFEPVPLAPVRDTVVAVAPPRAVEGSDRVGAAASPSVEGGAGAATAAPSAAPMARAAERSMPSAGSATATDSARPKAIKPRAVAPKPAPKPKSKPAAQMEPAAPSASAAPRLKLDPVDLAPAAKGGSAPIAPSAATATPGSAGAPPEQASPLQPAVSEPTAEAQKLLDMEKALEGMRAEQASLRASMETVNAQLAQARDERYRNPLVYGLGALSAAALALLGWIWRQRRSGAQAPAQAPWWTASGATPGSPSAGASGEPAEVAEAADSLLAMFPATDMPPAGQPAGASVQTPAARRSDYSGMVVRESAGTARLSLQDVAPASFESLADLVQDVEFFNSLEQWGDALQRIDAFVREHPGASELPYLMRFRHCSQRGDDAGLLASEKIYLEHFHHPAPTPLDYADLAPGLEQDAALMSRLAAAWPTDAAKDLLEKALCSQADDEDALQVRSLEAYHDLLMLHAVLDTREQELSAAGSQPLAPATPSPSDPVGNAIAPSWASVSQFPDDGAPVTQPPSELMPLSAEIDIDLAHPVPAGSVPPATAPQTESPSRPAELPGLDFEFLDLSTSEGVTKGEGKKG